MRHPNLLLLSLLVLLTGCSKISPFIGADLKIAICDRDGDDLLRTSDYCGGNDCDDGDVSIGVLTWYTDLDMDTYGSGGGIVQCETLDGYAVRAGDCDDNVAELNPDIPENCDGIDNDCDDLLDELDDSVVDGFLRYEDRDSDTWGSEVQRTQCTEATGWVEQSNDCNDTDPLVNPNATELCTDAIDNNCNGVIDTDAVDVTWYRDADEDGWGDPDDTTTDCAPPTGYVGNATDCDDNDGLANPGVEEVCNNGVDDNCDGSRVPCEWSGTVSLADADATIDGTEEGGYAGFTLANAGDINGDGYEDLLMSASQVHEIYIFFGPVTGSLNASTADITLTGPTGSYAGMALAGSCDLQGDGTLDDLLIGGPYDGDGGTEAGAVWIFHGPWSSGSYNLNLDADTKLVGEASSRFGTSVACGDQDGDGDDDILVGASNDDASANDAGAAYLGNSPVSDFSEMFLLSGEAMDDATGTVVLMADLNGDGNDDLVVGAHQEDTMGTSAGAVSVLYGPVTTSGSLADADVKLLGENAGDFAGRTIRSADIDLDGNDDLIVGAYGFNTYTGATYVVYGPPSSGSLGSHLRLDGEASGDNASFGLAQPCDFDGDGNLDIFVGAREESSVATDTGATYIVYGPVASSTSLGSAGTKLTGVTSGDYAGASLTTMDLDSDGFCDLVVGAYLADYTGTNTGRASILYGLGY